MKISVIVPTYKPQVYLWECLDSLCKQTFNYNDFEVVLILNGCCEPYNSAIKEYIQKHADVNFVFKQIDQGGVSNARNIALDLAMGEYITFIDDDDYISPSYLKELYEKASRDIISLCYPLSFVDGKNNYEEYYITGDYNKNCNNEKCNYFYARKYFSGPVYKLIHRDVIGDRRFDKSFTNGEDSLFMFLISDKFRYVAFTSKDAIYYRRVRENSANSNNKNVKEVIKNKLSLIREYIRVFNFRSYSMSFFATRILGAIHILVLSIFKR